MVAAATQLPDKSAFEMLQESYIEAFISGYDSVCAKFSEEHKQPPAALNYLILFSLRELPIRTDVSSNIVQPLQSREDMIRTAMLEKNISDMLTELCSRDEIKQAVERYLRKENNNSAMAGTLRSNRVSVVFQQFLDMFRVSCAHAFQFRGSFLEFAMHCFIQFFYKPNKRDIWATLSEADAAKREVETSIVQERVLDVKVTDDLLIHDIMQNMSIVNDKLFMHSGQSAEFYGVMYDLYYLILCLLCEEKVDQINSELRSRKLKTIAFIDPHDYANAYGEAKRNKGIAAKIRNSKEIVSKVLRTIRTNEFNVDGLPDLRNECFKSGRTEIEGRNCVWAMLGSGGETSHYLNDMDAMHNFRAFDEILRGVAGVYTLMVELENRGRDVVDFYRADIFKNKDILRYIDYLSAFDHIDTIQALQQEPVDWSKYTDELFEFNRMVDEYAGSAVNNHTNIRENRYYAVTHGFMRKPQLKQSVIPVSEFERIKQVANALTATPHSADSRLREIKYLSRGTELAAPEVVAGKYWIPYHNSFLLDLPDKLDFFLKAENGVSARELATPNVWHLSDMVLDMAAIGQVRVLWSSFHNNYAIVPPPGSHEYGEASWEDVVKLTRETNTGVHPLQARLCDCGPAFDGIAHRTRRGISLPYNVGFTNLLSAPVQDRLAQLRVDSNYRRYTERFYIWLGECGAIAELFKESLRVLLEYAIYTKTVYRDDTKRVREMRAATDVMSALSSLEVRKDSLDWLLNEIHSREKINRADSSTPRYVLTPVNLGFIGLCFGEVPSTLSGLSDSWMQIIKGEYSPAERFVLLFDLLYTRLEFLRRLRDGIGLTFGTIAIENVSLVCELVNTFGIERYMRQYTGMTPQGLLSIVSDSSNAGARSLKIQARKWREECSNEFYGLLDAVFKYYKECEGEIASLLSYDISSKNAIADKFSQYGSLFSNTADYTGFRVLDFLRKTATMDSSGFFLYGGKYFQGRIGNAKYYVHRTGRLLCEMDGQLSPVVLDMGDSKSCRWYEAVLANGLDR